jgi:hypothetical protein
VGRNGRAVRVDGQGAAERQVAGRGRSREAEAVVLQMTEQRFQRDAGTGSYDGGVGGLQGHTGEMPGGVDQQHGSARLGPRGDRQR